MAEPFTVLLNRPSVAVFWFLECSEVIIADNMTNEMRKCYS